jgi:hypothetical protein
MGKSGEVLVIDWTDDFNSTDGLQLCVFRWHFKWGLA